MVALSSETKLVERNIRSTLTKALADSSALQRPHVILDEEDLQIQTQSGEEAQLALEDATAIEPQAASSSPSQEGNVTETRVTCSPRSLGHAALRYDAAGHFLRTEWHALTNTPLCDPPAKGVVDPPSGGCRPICKLCLG